MSSNNRYFKKGCKQKHFSNRNESGNVARTKAPQLREKDVYITEYISELEGINGVIKARYSDFQVNEIGLDGIEAKLTNIDVPKDFTTSIITDLEEEEEETRPEVVPTEIWEAIERIISINDDKSDEIVEFEVTALSKDERSQIHNAVKKKFGGAVVASTCTKEDKKYIQFKKFYKKASTSIDLRANWPTDKGDYVHFVVYKESLDTLSACYKISDCLRMKPSSFTYAGVKDKRAKTTQWFSVKKVLPSKLLEQTKRLWSLKIGNITIKDKPLKLGQLKGNRFRIALRNVSADDQLIAATIDGLKNNGFINYYGLQRFGNDREVPTYLIGVKLLQGKFKEACELILKLKASDDLMSDTLAAKKMYAETRDAKKACKLFRRKTKSCIEAKLLEGLAKNGPNDYVNSLENVSRNMRLMYIHSFQSLIWNKMVSRRVKEFGFKPIEGDLVLVNEENDIVPEDYSEDVTENQTQKEEKSEKKIKNVKFLTNDDLNSFTIFDIVLPLPGYDVQYPNNIVKEWYKEALSEYNLTIEMPKQTVKSYNLSGSYRKIVGQVENLQWYTLLYNDPNSSLIRSDWEELKGEMEPKSIPDGKFKALIVDFILSSANYATMALREILKSDTSANAQTELNDYYKEVDCKKEEESSTNSLLDNPEKFAAFKNLIFGAADNKGVKRKTDEIEDEDDIKRIKTEDSKT